MTDTAEDGESRKPSLFGEPWQFVRLVRQPSGFGVAVMTVRHKDKGSIVVPLMVSDLHQMASQALAAMEPDIGGPHGD